MEACVILGECVEEISSSSVRDHEPTTREHGTRNEPRREKIEATNDGGQRLQKIISQAGLASRRAAEKLIADGRVTINGKTVREMGTKADPAHDDIRVDGRRIKSAERLRYILLYKPAGFVTTRSDPERRRTVIDLLEGVREYVYPVGRLDYDTEGLLLLTNDGDLAAKLTHPRHGVERTYEARVARHAGYRRHRSASPRHPARRAADAAGRRLAAEQGRTRSRGRAGDHHSRRAQPPGAPDAAKRSAIRCGS